LQKRRICLRVAGAPKKAKRSLRRGVFFLPHKGKKKKGTGNDENGIIEQREERKREGEKVALVRYLCKGEASLLRQGRKGGGSGRDLASHHNERMRELARNGLG